MDQRHSLASSCIILGGEICEYLSQEIIKDIAVKTEDSNRRPQRLDPDGAEGRRPKAQSSCPFYEFGEVRFVVFGRTLG